MSDVVFQSSLAAKVEALQRCLDRVASFLERAEATRSKLSLLPAVLSPLGKVDVGPVEDLGVELFGCLSPRVGVISSPLSTMPSMSSTIEGETVTDVVAPVLQIMPDLQDLCARPSLPLSVEHVKEDSPVTLCSHERSDVSSVPFPPPSALNPDALFAKELCDVLSSLGAAVPGCGRALACLLTGSTLKSKSKKVGDCARTGTGKEKSLRLKGKKKDAIGKVPVAA
jgi:hypothetical protein